jgi:hypothetical protein
MQNGVAKVLELSAQFSAVGRPHKKKNDELKKIALERKLGSIDLTGTATQARRYPQSAYRLADQRKNASPRT